MSIPPTVEGVKEYARIPLAVPRLLRRISKAELKLLKEREGCRLLSVFSRDELTCKCYPCTLCIYHNAKHPRLQQITNANFEAFLRKYKNYIVR